MYIFFIYLYSLLLIGLSITLLRKSLMNVSMGDNVSVLPGKNLALKEFRPSHVRCLR